MSRAQVVSLVIVLTSVFLLLAVPRTRWLVELHLEAIAGQGSEIPTNQRWYEASQHGLFNKQAAARPDGYAEDLAVAARAIQYPEDATVFPQMEALAAKYPNQPVVYANALRLESAQLSPGRFRKEGLLTALGDSRDDYHGHKPFPVTIGRTFTAQVAAGERLDPDNAYFPAMSAVVLFAASRDTEALAALHRAARCKRWDSYMRDLVTAGLRYDDRNIGVADALTHMHAYGTISYSDGGTLRSITRIAMAHAITAERNGDSRAGLKIRVDLLRVGSLIRTQSTYAMNALVGIAIEEMAADQLSSGETRRLGDELDAAQLTKADISLSGKISDMAADLRNRENSKVILGGALLLNIFWLVALGLAATALRAACASGLQGSDRTIRIAAQAVITMALISAMVFFGYRQSHSLLAAYASNNELTRVYRNLTELQATRTVVAAEFALPILVCLAALIVGIIKRKAILRGFVDGCARFSLPMAAIAVLVYVWLAASAAAIDGRLDKIVLQLSRNETAYYLRSVGKTMPPAAQKYTHMA